MPSYILTYYRLRKREHLIALGFHRVGVGLIYASAVSDCGDTAKWRFRESRVERERERER